MKYINHRSGHYNTQEVRKLLRTLKEHDYILEFKKRYSILQSVYKCYPSPITNFMNSYNADALIDWFSRTQEQGLPLRIKLTQTYNEIYKTK